MPKVSMTVNGRPVSGEVEGRTLLVEFLREGLRLTGTHVGCDTAQCGACVVHVDGVSVKSCNVLALDVDGAEVRTIEGMANPDGSLGVIQAAFQTHHGLQCGFCTPGMVMTAAALLDENAEPERERRSASTSTATSAAAPATTTSSRRSRRRPPSSARRAWRPSREGGDGTRHRHRRVRQAPRGRALPDRQGALHRRPQPARAGLRALPALGRGARPHPQARHRARPRRCRACSRSSPRRTSRASAASPAAGWSPTATASR